MSQQFGAVLAAGLAVFGLAFVFTQAAGDLGGGNADTPDRMVLLERSYGELGGARPASRTAELGSFSVGEARGDILALRRDRAEVSSGFLSSDSVKVDYNATQPRQGSVTFEVLGSTGKGKVFVKVNGNTVFKNALVAGGTPEVTIPEGAINPGQNTIVIGTTSGGVLSSSEYAIEDLQVRVNDRKFHDRVDTFQMYGYELTDFVDAKASFRVTEAVKTSPLKVSVNGNQLYDFSPVRGVQEFNLTPSSAELRNGLNTVRFETDGEASYRIENAAIEVRYLGSSQEVSIDESFDISESELNYADRNSTVETLRFDYTSLLGSPRTVNVTLNGESHVFTPSNGRNTVDVSSELERDNRLTIKSQGSFQMNNVEIASEAEK